MAFVIGGTTSFARPLPLSSLRNSSFQFQGIVNSNATTKIRNRRSSSFLNLATNNRFGSSRDGGAAILERPSFDQSQFDPSTRTEEGGDIGRLSDKKGVGSGDSYKVLLIDDIRHTEKLVAKVLPQVVPSVTPDEARGLFHESREKGVAVVIVTVKEHAEFYAQMMIRGGLSSKIEPADSTTAA